MSENHIALLINSLTSGGAERNAEMLTRYLAEHGGLRVTLITASRSRPDFFTPSPKVKRIYLEEYCPSSGSLIAGIYRLRGVPTLRSIVALRKILIRKRINVVIGMMTDKALLAIIASCGINAKVITSERNYPAEREIRAPWGAMRWLLYRFAHAHVAQTEQTAHWLRSRCGAKNVKVIPNAIRWPLPLMEPKLNPNEILPDRTRVLLGVGSLSRQKGFDLLIRAFSTFAQEHNNWYLVIIGGEGTKDRDGSRRADLEALSKELGLGGRVLLPGRAGNIIDWYRRADIFVLSSRYEGFPNVLLEAMSAGCACVAFDCNTGPRNMITHGRNGLLVRNGSPPHLAASLKQVVVDDALRSRLARIARQVRFRYSEDVVCSEWLANIIPELSGFRG